MAVDKPVEEFVQETLASLDENKRFVMYDANEGRTASLEIIQDYILDDLPDRMDAAEDAIEENEVVVADEYSASSTYAVGDYCMHSGALYRCTTAIVTAEAWTVAHWQLSSIGTTKGILLY